MFCVRSLGRAGPGDPSLRLGNSSSTCSSSTCSLKGELGKGLVISSGWTKKSVGESRVTTGGLGAVTKGICASPGRIFKIEKEDREVGK